MSVLCKPQDNSGKEDQISPSPVTRPLSLHLPLLFHSLPHLLSHPNIWDLLMNVSPFHRQW
jgi:hypothetical protein